MPCKTIGKRVGEIARYALYTSCAMNYRCIKTMVAVGDSLPLGFFHAEKCLSFETPGSSSRTSWLVLCVAQLVVCLPSTRKVLRLISSIA